MQTVSRRQPLIMGKPEPLMFEAIRTDHGVVPERTIMIGDK
jgi:ribonucleotide monophosphatase NagD (HAD superfamily)